MSTFKSDIEKFDGKNDFLLWKENMTTHLGILGLDDALKGLAKMPQTMSDEKKEVVMKRASNTIILSLGDQVLRKVIKEKTAAAMWLRLEQLYMTKTLPSRIYLKQKFYSFKMDEGKTVDDNINDFTKLISDLESLEVEIDEEDQAIFLMNSLPKPYEQLKDTLKYGKETLSLDEVISAAYSKELDLKSNGKIAKATSEGLNVRGRPEKKSSGKNKGRSKSKDSSSTTVTCWNCNKEGHYRRNCPEKKQEKGDGKTKKNNNNSKNGDVANILDGLDTCDVLSVSNTDPQEQWILDTGCTYHMTPRKDFFCDYQDYTGGKVLMGNNDSCDVIGLGSIILKMSDGTQHTLTDVRHIPDLKRNLISLGTLDALGYNFKSQGGVLRIYKGVLQVMKGKLEHGLYVLEGETFTGEASTINMKPERAEVWHRRLGHMSVQGMTELNKQGVLKVTGLSDFQLCENCVLGKSHRLKFPKAIHNTKGTLDYIHSDLWGSPNVPHSLSKCQYFITFIDDFSRKVWIYFLKTKDEAFSKFLEWKALVETQTERKIKRLRTDNGLEFCNEARNCKKAHLFRDPSAEWPS